MHRVKNHVHSVLLSKDHALTYQKAGKDALMVHFQTPCCPNFSSSFPTMLIMSNTYRSLSCDHINK